MSHHVRQWGLALIVVALAAPVGTAQSTDPAYIGKWKLNVAKSKYEPGPPPKSGMRTHEDRGGGLVIIWTEGVNAQGQPTHGAYAYKLDGKDYPQAQPGNASLGTIALKATDANTVTFTTKQDGKAVGTGTRTLSKDGKTMTIATKGTNAQGQATSTTQIWEKQP